MCYARGPSPGGSFLVRLNTNLIKGCIHGLNLRALLRRILVTKSAFVFLALGVLAKVNVIVSKDNKSNVSYAQYTYVIAYSRNL